MLTLNAVWYGPQQSVDVNAIELALNVRKQQHFLSNSLCFCLSRLVDLVLKAIMRAMWFSGGFHWVRVKGRAALPSEAPILTMAPHSSYFDAIPVTMTMASIVMKAESKDIPVWGSEFLKIYKYMNIWILFFYSSTLNYFAFDKLSCCWIDFFFPLYVKSYTVVQKFGVCKSLMLIKAALIWTKIQ